MQNNRAIKTAFVISLAGHCFLLGMPGINMIARQHKEPEDVVVRIEIEKPPLVPKIDVMGEERKFPPEADPPLAEKEIVKKEELSEPEPEEQIKEVMIEKPEPPKEIVDPVRKKRSNGVEVINPQEEAMLRYQDMIKQKIESLRRYPNWAKRQGLEGISCLVFTLLSNGAVQDIKIVHSSGFEILDKEAISTIKRAAPFRPIPEKFNRSSLTMEVSLVFQLKW